MCTKRVYEARVRDARRSEAKTLTWRASRARPRRQARRFERDRDLQFLLLRRRHRVIFDDVLCHVDVAADHRVIGHAFRLCGVAIDAASDLTAPDVALRAGVNAPLPLVQRRDGLEA